MNGWDKPAVSKVIGIALWFLIALLGAFGYDVVISQPRNALLSAQVRMLEDRMATAPVTLEPFCACPSE